MNKKITYLTCKDHTVSGEYFDLHHDKTLDLLATFPQPDVKKLPTYYKSETYISHTDASKTTVDKIYQWVKKYTLGKKLQLINSFKTPQKTILDIGCGTGDFLKVCKKNGWTVTGVEPNEKAKKIAEKKLNSHHNTNLYSEINNLPKNAFDIITLWHVLEHVPNIEEYIIALKKLLKPQGVLIIAVPNFKSFDAKYYQQFWAAFDAPRHLWHFSKTSIQKLFAKEQMRLVKIIPMKFDAFYVALLSEKYKHGKNNFVKAFCIGCLSNFKAWRNKEYSSLIYAIKNTNGLF